MASFGARVTGTLLPPKLDSAREATHYKKLQPNAQGYFCSRGSVSDGLLAGGVGFAGAEGKAENLASRSRSAPNSYRQTGRTTVSLFSKYLQDSGRDPIDLE
jgi:hypothetical protein